MKPSRICATTAYRMCSNVKKMIRPPLTVSALPRPVPITRFIRQRQKSRSNSKAVKRPDAPSNVPAISLFQPPSNAPSNAPSNVPAISLFQPPPNSPSNALHPLGGFIRTVPPLANFSNSTLTNKPRENQWLNPRIAVYFLLGLLIFLFLLLLVHLLLHQAVATRRVAV